VAVVADTRQAGQAYVLTTRYESPELAHVNRGEKPAKPPSITYGPVGFTKTVDGGSTWSSVKTISPRVANGRVSAPQAVIDPRTGRIYVVYYRADRESRALALVMSDDGGGAWSEERDIAAWVRGPRVKHPTTGDDITLAEDIVRPAMDGRTGAVHVAYADARVADGKQFGVSLVSSSDRGESWRAPLAVSTEPTETAWLPAVAVDAAGRVAVAYLTADFSRKRSAVAVTLRLVTYASRAGKLIEQERRVLDRYDYVWPGDYFALVAVGDTFRVVYARSSAPKAPPENPADVFFRPVQYDPRR
jgi:hypothetical protein